MAITGIKMRSEKYRVMHVTVPSGGVVAGAMNLIESTVVVYFETKAAGLLVAAVNGCDKILLPKAAGSALAMAQGSKVYFDNSAKNVTPTAGGNTLCGRVLEAASGAATEVLVDFNGTCAA
jgi:predicted RecA/RadA family phage recombinase